MPKTQNVADGDCCSSLAVKNGFPDYKGLYNVQNAAFKTQHPNPNQLTLGFAYAVPPVVIGSRGGGTDASHVSHVTTSKVNLRLRLKNMQAGALACKQGQLTVDGDKNNKPPFAPASLPGGLIEQKNIVLSGNSAKLRVELTLTPVYSHPAPVDPPPRQAGAMPYPPPIVAGQFQDQEDAAYLGLRADIVNWQIKIGSLPTHKVAAGIQARLQNLGFSLQDGLPAAARRYQHWRAKHGQALPVTGKWEDIAEDIRKYHDEP